MIGVLHITLTRWYRWFIVEYPAKVAGGILGLSISKALANLPNPIVDQFEFAFPCAKSPGIYVPMLL
jgi:hypothetical protein